MIGPSPNVASGTEDAIVHVTADGGASHRLIEYFNISEQCIPTDAVAQAFKLPKMGTLKLTAVDFEVPKSLPWPAQDARARCLMSKSSAIAVDYIPRSGFSGRDLAQVNVVDHGHTSRLLFVIDVK
jgi:hypothetical protein